MYAERVMLETDVAGKLKQVPVLPANKRVEAIFLVMDEAQPITRRQPAPEIAGKTKILGEVFDSAPAADWDLSK
ncbi:MAG: hypothetical protein PHH47_02870 [Gallionella sp.]|nr:hypothetical protein [Gallionella sp.]MDD4945819.1 hypothetical protein [Gallionella sp.]